MNIGSTLWAHVPFVSNLAWQQVEATKVTATGEKSEGP